MEVFHVTSYRHCSGVVYHVRCDIATTDGGKGIFLVANQGLLVYDCWRIVVVPCSLHRRCQLACKDALQTSSQAAKRKQKKKTKAAQTANRQCSSSKVQLYCKGNRPAVTRRSLSVSKPVQTSAE